MRALGPLLALLTTLVYNTNLWECIPCAKVLSKVFAYYSFVMITEKRELAHFVTIGNNVKLRKTILFSAKARQLLAIITLVKSY